MNIQQLMYVLKILECRSITRAAQELYMSQPALTKAISSLEKEYNIKIFDRSSKGVILTSEGKEFVHYAKSIIYNMKILDDAFKTNKIEDKACLLIGAQELDFTSGLFVDIYNEYRENGSEFEFELYKSNRADVAKAVKTKACNIGILIRSTFEAEGIEWNLENNDLDVVVLDTSRVYLHMGKKSSLYNKEIIEYKDVELLPQICLDVSELSRSQWRIDINKTHFNLDNIVYCNCINLCIKLLENTNATLFTPKWLNGFFSETSIKSVEVLSDKKDICELICITRKGDILSNAEVEFIEMLKERLQVRKK